MIPTPDQWKDLDATPEGRLRDIPYPTLLATLSRSRRSADLELLRKPVEKRITVENGVPVDCRSNLVHETLGRYLVTVGRLSEADFNATLSESLTREVPLGEILLERGLVEPEDLFRQLQQNLARKLLDGFTWRDGTFRLRAETTASDSTLRVKVPQLILTGILKLSPLAEVNRAIQPLLTQTLARNPEPPFSPGELRLTGPSAQVLEALERPLRMDELASRAEISPDDLGRVLYGLALLEVVVPSARLITGTTLSASLARTPEEPAQEAPEAPAQLRSRVLEAFLSFKRKDPFDLLRLEEDASSEDIDLAFLTFSRAFAPWAPTLSPDLQEKCRALYLAGAEAYGELCDTERRNTLLYRRKVQRDERARRPKAEMTIRTDLLDPEAQFSRGQRLFQEGQLQKALEFLQFASDCDPQNAAYRAEATYCRFLLGPTIHGDETIAELHAALRIDGKCGIAFYYLGETFASLGRTEDAERSLRRAIKLLAPDRRPIDALRRLRSGA